MSEVNQFFNALTTNSFISHVNELVDKFGKINEALALPATFDEKLLDMKNILDGCKIYRDESVIAMNDTRYIKDQTIAIRDSTNKLMDIAKAYSEESMGYKDEASNILVDVKREKRDFENDVVLAKGLINLEVMYKFQENVEENYILTIPQFRYIVGRNTLRVSVDGVIKYRCIDYEEQGDCETVSSSIVIKKPLNANSIINLWNISSNSGEDAYQRAKCVYKQTIGIKGGIENIKDSIDVMYRNMQNMRDDMEKLASCGMSIESVENENDVPDHDCFYLVTGVKFVPECNTSEAPSCSCGGGINSNSICARIEKSRKQIYKR